MGHTFVNSSIILAESLDLFKNNLRMGNLVYKDYAKEFKGTPKIGESFQIRNPWRFEVQDGPTINLVDLTETTVTMQITAHKVIPLAISTRDKTMKVDEFRKKYLEDAMIKLANTVDMDLAGLYDDVYQAVGTAGTTPNAYSIFGDAATKLDFMSCPPGNRNVVLDPPATYTMADAMKGLFNAQMVEGYIKEGKLTNMAGLGGIYSTQNIKQHTAGTQDGNYVVSVTSVAGATTLVVKTGAGTWETGDIFTVAGVYSVNPVNYESTGQLQQFVVTSDEGVGGSCTLNVSPTMYASGPLKNINAYPQADAAITGVASHKANLVFHQKAFALATVPFELPETAPVKEQLSADGVVMTLTGGWDITNYREIYRLDILYGVKTIRPEWACRIMG